MTLFKESIESKNLDLQNEIFPIIIRYVEVNPEMISYFLDYKIVDILLNLINSTPITMIHTHKNCFTLLGCLALCSPDEIEVSTV